MVVGSVLLELRYSESEPAICNLTAVLLQDVVKAAGICDKSDRAHRLIGTQPDHLIEDTSEVDGCLHPFEGCVRLCGERAATHSLDRRGTELDWDDPSRAVPEYAALVTHTDDVSRLALCQLS